MELTWLGHACFLVEQGGYRILLDPYTGVEGYPPLYETAVRAANPGMKEGGVRIRLPVRMHIEYTDGPVTPGEEKIYVNRVLCSHGHGDHCGTEGVSLRQGRPSPFTVETINTWHDDKEGALRGPNTIHVLSDGQCRIAHLGDLGCDLATEQTEKLRNLTALLIPVGGHFTIDAVQAKRLVDELSPVVVVPMHYRQAGVGYDVIGTVEQFTKLCDDVVDYPGSELELTPQTGRQTAVLKPQNA